MKKFLCILLILLTSCARKEDYYSLSIDDYVVTVGHDDAKYMSLAFDYDLPNQLEAYETIKDVDVMLNDDLLGICEFTNQKKKIITSDNAILTKLTLYVNDLPQRKYKLNGEELSTSIKTNCDKYNGTFIEKNGYACVIENKVRDELNVVELYGDYLNIDQDELDHIVIYVE